MALYEVPLNYDANDFVIPLKNTGYSCLFYKSEEGPFGFCVNEESENILFDILKNCTWFSILNSNFQTLSYEVFEKCKFNMKGFIFLDDKFELEISGAKSILVSRQKNQLLLRYKKPLIEVPSNNIIDSFESMICVESNISKILKNNNVLIWNWSEFGGHIIFHDFEGCILKNKIAKFKLIAEKSIDNVPSW
jgi:hypothetical protein